MLNSGMLLDHKLSLIKLLYTDERFKKLCDHDCIIKWCADILPTLSIEEELKVYNCLSVCLKSNSMSHLDGQGFLKTLLSVSGTDVINPSYYYNLCTPALL